MYRMLSLAFLLAFLTSPAALAQGRFALELGGEADFATQDLGPSTLDVGFGSELSLHYQIIPTLAAYAGWGYHRFNADGFLPGTDVTAEETGYTFGLLFTYPLGRTPYSGFLKAGGVYDHIEFEDDGDLLADTDHG
ncbi:MAG: opacity protein, partial [Bacteroidota bacterium]